MVLLLYNATLLYLLAVCGEWGWVGGGMGYQVEGGTHIRGIAHTLMAPIVSYLLDQYNFGPLSKFTYKNPLFLLKLQHIQFNLSTHNKRKKKKTPSTTQSSKSRKSKIPSFFLHFLDFSFCYQNNLN